MSDLETKGNSPFYPNHPVPPELFTGRAEEIEYLMERGVGQTSRGKPTAFYISGEYGIGKSSIAGYLRTRAEQEAGLLGIRADLAGARTLAEVAAAVLAGVIRTGVYNPNRVEQIKNWLGKYIGKQTLFGLTVNLEALALDAPAIAGPGQILAFLREVRQRFTIRNGVKGVFLVLDEINGIAAVPEFAHFLKSLIETNSAAMTPDPLPLIIILCGTEARRRQIVECHEPTNRLFDIVPIRPLNDVDVEKFFAAAFISEKYTIEPEAMSRLVLAAAGLPKVMHLLGDKTYFRAKGRHVDVSAAIRGIFDAAEEVGQQFVDHKVLSALRSADYQSMLEKLSLKSLPLVSNFTRQQLAAELSEPEKRKLGKFLARLQELGAIRPGASRGEYEFCSRMVQTYLWLRSFPTLPELSGSD